MDVQRFDFRELNSGVPPGSRADRPSFMPAAKKKEEVPPPPPAPVFSEEDIKAAEREGYKKGFLEGTQEGRKQAETEQMELDRRIAASTDRFVKFVEPLLADYRQFTQNHREQLPRLALAIARKVAGAAITENAEALVAAMVEQCCAMLASEPKIVIAVHESLGDGLQQRLASLAARLPASTEIVILRDPNMPLGDCRIEWEHGAMTRDTSALWQQLEQIVEGMALTAGKEAPTSNSISSPASPEGNVNPPQGA